MLLTEPVTLGPRTAPSRVMFGPHETNLARHRAFSARHTAYYERRAAGGAGVIVTETASVHPSDWPYERAPLAADCGPGWASVVRACRPHGTLVIASLGHAGSQGSSAYHQRALWAPSRVADVASRELPMEMEQPELAALVAGFGAAAEVAAGSGLDGVEVDAGQYSLLRQFLSGLTNQRPDDYGTDRVRLLREVLDTVRESIGADRVLGLRLSCDELAPWAGITPEQATDIVAGLTGRIDYLVVVRGSAMGTAATRPDFHTPPGFNTELCATVRASAAGAVPVVLQGSVVEPDAAQGALDAGVCDLVEMTRAQIAEPRLVALVRAGRPERIRPCVLCNQKCRVRDSRNPVVSCAVEPGAGHESVEPGASHAKGEAAHVASPPLDVLVVGGGPAGLEAARVLALRGHRVGLAERAPRLGGTLHRAGERWARLADWLAAEVLRLGVTVRTGVEVTRDDLAGRRVLLATGSVPGPRAYAVEEGVQVVEAAEVLGGTAELPEGLVLVYDPVGDATGTAVAERLAASGRTTAILTQDQVIGTQLALTGDLADANTRLQQAGVRLLKRSALRSVGRAGAVVEDVLTGERHTVDCAAVVHCGHRLPDTALASESPGTPRAGDCVAPRTVHEAILEGRRAALALERTAEAHPAAGVPVAAPTAGVLVNSPGGGAS
ncbi:mycofactocin system FadH/OYE family oxidoreductase 1 [Streptomyces monticola]|uniref:Mycofactocin system FadH/OYE family oxidoreductase 1 n=1 Tax=Streptomyces monticola TaxID=2666263 RepID=A0ABW2JY65_9ACTN